MIMDGMEGMDGTDHPGDKRHGFYQTQASSGLACNKSVEWLTN